MKFFLVLSIFNIIIVYILIFISKYLNNCDKFKIPKYDKTNISNH